jgi:hypothetical protein
MDDFSIYGKTFMDCLANMDKVLTRCAEVDLVLNWEKCHFMVKKSIVLGHVISEREESKWIRLKWKRLSNSHLRRMLSP